MKSLRSNLLLALSALLLVCGLSLAASSSVPSVSQPTLDCASSCAERRDKMMERCGQMRGNAADRCREMANTQYNNCVARCKSE